ncbi:MAG TPA: MATE family efflux transporter [Afifellaceae bacterium]|nr:MATE family efflux transporter [Afifellaceae bacterium]
MTDASPVARPAASGRVRPFAVTHASVLRIAVPMTLAHLSTPVVGLVDTAVIGQLGEAALIGGIAVAAIVFDIVFTTFNFLRGATTGLTAQAVGAEDASEEQAVLMRAFGVALAAGIAVVALQVPLGAIGFAALGVGGEVAQAALAYFAIRIWATPFALANYVVLGWLLGRAEAAIGLALQVLLNGLNVALSLHFVLGFDWGIAGVAVATLLAEAVTAAAGVAIVLARLPRAGRPPVAYVFELTALKRMLAVNRDMMIRSFALLFAFAFFTRQGVQYGEVVLAANAILMHFFMVGSYFLDGLAAAAEQRAGRAVGARYRPAFVRAVKLTALWGLLLGLGLSAVYVAVGTTIVDIMTTAPEVRETARAFLPWAVLTPLAGAIAFQMDGIFIGATWSRDMRNMMLLSLVVYLAAWAALTPAWGNDGLWAALLIFLGARSVSFLLRMRRRLPETFPPEPAAAAT